MNKAKRFNIALIQKHIAEVKLKEAENILDPEEKAEIIASLTQMLNSALEIINAA